MSKFEKAVLAGLLGALIAIFPHQAVATVGCPGFYDGICQLSDEDTSDDCNGDCEPTDLAGSADCNDILATQGLLTLRPRRAH